MLRLFAVASLAWIALAPVPGMAQCLLCTGDSNAAPASGPAEDRDEPRPLTLEIVADLDFSRLTTGADGGDVAVDPVSGASTVAGDLRDLSAGRMLSGVARVTGEPGRPVRILLPGDVDLVADSGAVARLVQLRTDLGPAPRIGSDGVLEFRFGGRLRVTGNGDGNYRGRVPITVGYE